MIHDVIELLETIVLEKKECTPITFESGDVLKVLEEYHDRILVSTDANFTFTLAKKDEGIRWKKL
ncbi:hypothetical protein [Acinetobacter sp. HY1485]|uniref:hypothetical protein n=1 Tax=Acinetobacter sp. HY1485 TaxID=2970918 RepID=UPI0022B95529|nr:hypothetical protein [Acinetobacter sp. HY1485]